VHSDGGLFINDVIIMYFSLSSVYSSGTSTMNPWTNQYGQHRYMTTKPIYYTNLCLYCRL